MTIPPALDVGAQRSTADHSRCWGDDCYHDRGPQRPIHHQALGLCERCYRGILGEFRR